MPDLIAPTPHLHDAWLAAYAEWGPGLHEDGFGLLATDEVESAAGFAAWVARVADPPHRAVCRWIVENGDVLGGIALRHGPDDYVRWAGHIGFGIRPGARRRGLGSWALGRMLDENHGLERALVVCAASNLASARTIERAGGVYEETRETEFGALRRYWISR